MYKIELKLNHNEAPAKINKETGEVIVVGNKPNNLPEGKSKLDYNNFCILNTSASKELTLLFSNEELGVIFHMVLMADFNTNALKPLNNDLSIRCKADILNLPRRKVLAITDKLFRYGVYMSVKIFENDANEYWVLNPYLSWKGKLKNDSLFYMFSDCPISKLLR